MKRKALIITNPGTLNDENYCRGVLIDQQRYYKFFCSPKGGAYFPDDVTVLQTPTPKDLKKYLDSIKGNLDFFIMVFCGHGYYNPKLDTNVFMLNSTADVAENSLLDYFPSKAILIADCCREKYVPSFRFSRIVNAKDNSLFFLDREKCRKYYDEQINMCQPQTIRVYACGIDQTAQDDSQRGGLYSYNLLNIADSISPIDCWSIVHCHNKAEQQVLIQSNGKQCPQISKPRILTPYLPFAVAVK